MPKVSSPIDDESKSRMTRAAARRLGSVDRDPISRTPTKITSTNLETILEPIDKNKNIELLKKDLIELNSPSSPRAIRKTRRASLLNESSTSLTTPVKLTKENIAILEKQESLDSNQLMKLSLKTDIDSGNLTPGKRATRRSSMTSTDNNSKTSAEFVRITRGRGRDVTTNTIEKINESFEESTASSDQRVTRSVSKSPLQHKRSVCDTSNETEKAHAVSSKDVEKNSSVESSTEKMVKFPSKNTEHTDCTIPLKKLKLSLSGAGGITSTPKSNVENDKECCFKENKSKEELVQKEDVVIEKTPQKKSLSITEQTPDSKLLRGQSSITNSLSVSTNVIYDRTPTNRTSLSISNDVTMEIRNSPLISIGKEEILPLIGTPKQIPMLNLGNEEMVDEFKIDESVVNLNNSSTPKSSNSISPLADTNKPYEENESSIEILNHSESLDANKSTDKIDKNDVSESLVKNLVSEKISKSTTAKKMDYILNDLSEKSKLNISQKTPTKEETLSKNSSINKSNNTSQSEHTFSASEKENSINKSFSRSWSQTVVKKVGEKIDTLQLDFGKKYVIKGTPEQRKIVDNENDEEDDDERNSFIDDEAIEVGDSECSMDSEERREMEENAIEEHGIDIGSEDSDENEESHNESNDSFVVSDGEDDELLDGVGDDLSFELSDKINKPKLVISSDSEDESKKKSSRKQMQVEDLSDSNDTKDEALIHNTNSYEGTVLNNLDPTEIDKNEIEDEEENLNNDEMEEENALKKLTGTRNNNLSESFNEKTTPVKLVPELFDPKENHEQLEIKKQTSEPNIILTKSKTVSPKKKRKSFNITSLSESFHVQRNNATFNLDETVGEILNKSINSSVKDVEMEDKRVEESVRTIFPKSKSVSPKRKQPEHINVLRKSFCVSDNEHDIQIAEIIEKKSVSRTSIGDFNVENMSVKEMNNDETVITNNAKDLIVKEKPAPSPMKKKIITAEEIQERCNKILQAKEEAKKLMKQQFGKKDKKPKKKKYKKDLIVEMTDKSVIKKKPKKLNPEPKSETINNPSIDIINTFKNQLDKDIQVAKALITSKRILEENHKKLQKKLKKKNMTVQEAEPYSTKVEQKKKTKTANTIIPQPIFKLFKDSYENENSETVQPSKRLPLDLLKKLEDKPINSVVTISNKRKGFKLTDDNSVTKKKKIVDFVEEPRTPPPRQTNINKFRESPITPKLFNGFKVTPVHNEKNKAVKRKLLNTIKEPTNVLPKTVWSSVGQFTVQENAPKTTKITNFQTEFIIQKDRKINKNDATIRSLLTVGHEKQELKNFKTKELYGKNIRIDSKKLIKNTKIKRL